MALARQVNDTRGLYVVTGTESQDTIEPVDQLEDSAPPKGWAKAPFDVMALTYLKANAKTVYFALDYFNGPRGCFPGRDRIMQATGLSADAVDRAIKMLVECGLITVTRRGKTKTNIYTFNPKSEWHDPRKSESAETRSHKGSESAETPTHESAKTRSHSIRARVLEPDSLLHAADAAAADVPDAAEGDDAPDTVEQDFEQRFWSVYPSRTNPSGRKVKGSRQRSLKAWSRMSGRQRDLAVLGIPDYTDAKNGMPNDAEKYLNQRMYLEHLPDGIDQRGKVDPVAQELAALREDQKRGRYAGRMEEFYAAEDAIKARMVQR